ncbi:MAG: hypothetical protein ACXVAY_13740 [Mucilaginibacter sp.]
MSQTKKGISETIREASIVIESENERLRKDIYRSDMEKFLLFTKMLRTNRLYNRVKVTHK